MTKTLSGIPNVIIYQDDINILVYSNSVHNHAMTLDKVICTLQNAGIKLNHGKSSFFLPEVAYLGYNFTKHGVTHSADKGDIVLALNLREGGPKWYKATVVERIVSNIYVTSYMTLMSFGSAI